MCSARIARTGGAGLSSEPVPEQGTAPSLRDRPGLCPRRAGHLSDVNSPLSAVTSADKALTNSDTNFYCLREPLSLWCGFIDAGLTFVLKRKMIFVSVSCEKLYLFLTRPLLFDTPQKLEAGEPIPPTFPAEHEKDDLGVR